jgi:hypothetical protein
MPEIAHNWISPVRIKVNASQIAVATAGAAQPEDRSAKQKTTFFDSIGQPEKTGQLSFVGELAGLRTDRAIYPNLDAWVRRFQARPAYKAAIARGGPYGFAS